MTAHTSCPICENKGIKGLKGYEIHNLSYCSICGFVFSTIVPSESELELYYQRCGKINYLSPVTLKRYDELLAYFKSYNRTNKILDFGCGNGYFLERAKSHGWSVYGMEYDWEANDICKEKGITMLNDKTPLHSGEFDVIYMSEVIEHLSFPLKYLRLLNDFLRPGGMIYITTPNFNCFSRRFQKESWNAFHIEHISFFTSKTIKQLLTDTGFSPQTIKTTGISLSPRSKKTMQLKDTETGKKPINETVRELAEEKILFSLIKRIINFFLNLTRLGDTIKCFAIKK